MRQIASRWVPGLVLTFAIVVAACAAEGSVLARYQALLAEGKGVIAAMVETLKEIGCDSEQVGELVARAAEDGGDPAQVAIAAVGVMVDTGQLACICPALGPILDMAPSLKEATVIAAKVLNSITGTDDEAEEARQEVINCALAHGINPADLLEEAEALGGGGPITPDDGEDGGGASPH